MLLLLLLLLQCMKVLSIRYVAINTVVERQSVILYYIFIQHQKEKNTLILQFTSNLSITRMSKTLGTSTMATDLKLGGEDSGRDVREPLDHHSGSGVGALRSNVRLTQTHCF